jgi:hypothetical protein
MDTAAREVIAEQRRAASLRSKRRGIAWMDATGWHCAAAGCADQAALLTVTALARHRRRVHRVPIARTYQVLGVEPPSKVWPA